MWRWEKKILDLGRHLSINALPTTPGFQKCRSLAQSKHLFIRKRKKHPAWIVNPQTQILRNCLFWLIDLQIRNCRFQFFNHMMSYSAPKAEFAVLVLGFEKLGLGLGTWQLWADNRKRLLSHL
jgi:hypothetical protein